MRAVRWIVLFTFVVTLALVAMAYMLPLSAAEDTIIFRSILAVTFTLAVLHTAAALLFLLGLKTYKSKTRTAYVFLSLGIVMVAIGTLQLPIITALHLGSTFWVKSGLEILPFLLSGLLIYTGMHIFGKQIGVTSFVTKAWVVVPAAIIAATLASFLPHAPAQLTEVNIDVTNGIIVWTTVLECSSALIIAEVYKRIGEHYKPAMRWLFASLMCAAIILVIAGLQTLLSPDGSELQSLFIDSISIATGITFLRAGYEFIKTEAY